MRLLLVNGPNLNLLGSREPGIYGSSTLAEVVAATRDCASQHDCELVDFQSNHEGAILDFIHEHAESADGLIINPGALTHYSVALRDAIAGTRIAALEVHLSNVHQRESFRHHSVISEVTIGQIVGLGPAGYSLAVQWFIDSHTRTSP